MFQFSSALVDRLRNFAETEKKGFNDVKTFLTANTKSPEFKKTVLSKLENRLGEAIKSSARPINAYLNAPNSEGGFRTRDVIRSGIVNLTPSYSPINQLAQNPTERTENQATAALADRVQANDPTLSPDERKRGEKMLNEFTMNIAGTTGGTKAAGEIAEQGSTLFGRLVKTLRGGEEKVIKPGQKTGFVQAAKDFFTENSKVLNRLGESGKALSGTMQKTYAQADIDAGKALNSVVAPLKKLSKKEQAEFVDIAEGRSAFASSPKVQQLADAWDAVRKEVAGRAENLNLFQRGTRENYFPRIINDEWINKPKNESKILKHLLETGQAKNEQEARVLLGNIRGGLESKQSFLTDVNQFKAGNLEYSRTADLPTEAYESDPVKSLTQYLTDSYRRINEVENFGRQGEKLDEFYNAIEGEGKDAAKARQIMEQVLGSAKGSFRTLTDPLMRYESGTKLATAFISNSGQATNTITTKGLGNTLRALGRIITDKDEAVEKAIKSGNLTDDFLRESLNEKYNSWVSKLPWMKVFGKVENFNRILEANASEFALNSMVKRVIKNPDSKLARRLLEKQYGVNPDKVIADGGLFGDEFLQAMNSGVRTSQFRTRPQDLPQALSHPDLKVFGQFKSFAFKQTQFVMDQVVKEAAAGNVTPLIRYIVAGAVLGEGVAGAKNAVKNVGRSLTGQETQDRPEGAQRIIDNIASTGGAGVIADAVQKLGKGNLDLYQWVFGPGVSDLINLGANVGKAAKTDLSPVLEGEAPIYTGDPTSLQRQGLKAIPYVGSGAADALAPTGGGGGSSRRSSPSRRGSGSVPTIKRRK
jgi:hypothetical protein